MPPRARRTTEPTNEDFETAFQRALENRRLLVFTSRDGNPNLIESATRRQERTNRLALRAAAEEYYGQEVLISDELSMTESPDFTNLSQALQAVLEQRRFR